MDRFGNTKENSMRTAAKMIAAAANAGMGLGACTLPSGKTYCLTPTTGG
ncbi:MAG: hypothetical protein HKL82_11045 [Acidimicrobiaceae bacterium]|nr:hypothetical protein [Acidimicrobiaceae bacterium]